MPLPKPGESESREEFISRCMSETKEEFPETDQRYAVCSSQWRRRKKTQARRDGMIGLSNSVKDEMLAAFANRQFVVALYEGDNELADAIYQRRAVQFSPPIGDGEVRYVENVATVLFEGFNSQHVVDHWGILDDAGQLRARYRLTEPLEVSAVMDCKFRAGELRIGIP